jgi:phage-related minor tail protein
MIDCPITSLAKGFDRVHNLMSMLGTVEKKRISYVNETLEYTVPMLKLGRRNFPMQESVYENIKFIMTNQIKLYNALNNAETVIISLKLGINISEETYLEMCNLHIIKMFN